MKFLSEFEENIHAEMGERQGILNADNLDRLIEKRILSCRFHIFTTGVGVNKHGL